MITWKNFTIFLNNQSKNANFSNGENEVAREIFITNLLDNDIQSAIFLETEESDQALTIAVNMTMGS